MFSVFPFGLISLTLSIGLLIFIKNQEKVKKGFLIFITWIIIILSFLSIICSAYHKIIFWKKYGIGQCRFMMLHEMNKKNPNMQDGKIEKKDC